MSLYSVVNNEENLTLHQKSLKALFHTPLHFSNIQVTYHGATYIKYLKRNHEVKTTHNGIFQETIIFQRTNPKCIPHMYKM